MKNILLFFLVIISCFFQSQELEIVTFDLKFFHHPHTNFRIDFKNQELSCLSYLGPYGENQSLYIFHNRTYKIKKREFNKLKSVLNKNIPDSSITKSRNLLDGGSFIIRYERKNLEPSRSMNINTVRNEETKYDYEKLDALFELAYTAVKDSAGVKVIDNAYRPYFEGLPIRKISKKPLEYKIWGSMSWDLKRNKKFSDFLSNLPSNKCVIIDTDDNLSNALQEDLLKKYVIHNSNIKFVNMKYLISTRKYINELKDEMRKAEIENKKFEVNNQNKIIYSLYAPNKKEFDIWLNKIDSDIEIPIHKLRKNCR